MEEKKKRPQAKNQATELAQSVAHMSSDATDPLGSWTGHPADEWEVPVQDADDL